METFNYKDDKFSIRPQAPPGGETHFNISDSGYGDKNIHHKYKRNNHPSNDINPPPNHVKREDVIESTPNGADPVTGNRPSIKLRAPPGGFSSFDNYEDNVPVTQESNVCEEPETKEPETEQQTKQEEQSSRRNSNSTNPFVNSREEELGKKKPYRPVYTPQAPPGGKSSISFGYDDEPINKPKPKVRPSPEFGSSSNDDYKPVYTPQAPPGGKSSISFSEEPTNNQPKPKQKPNPEFQESFFGAQETTQTKRNNRNNQNNKTFGSSIFGSNEEENKQYKPYYAPQAPPGGKDSISLGESSTTNNNRTGRRRNYENDQFRGSNFTNNEDENSTYKPYYAPQAPPGGKDSISLGFGESSNTNNNHTGRRRNYDNDQFRGSNFTNNEEELYLQTLLCSTSSTRW